ncbi:hypothetical protein V5O48_001975 [Marasmius crinis-equi]|uniref:Uncharacterized protein n=1 Tax=Marasmius crinis-equi TaxID=585013 RepID=A0ABR3FX57_9AGAR
MMTSVEAAQEQIVETTILEPIYDMALSNEKLPVSGPDVNRLSEHVARISIHNIQPTPVVDLQPHISGNTLLHISEDQALSVLGSGLEGTLPEDLCDCSFHQRFCTKDGLDCDNDVIGSTQERAWTWIYEHPQDYYCSESGDEDDDDDDDEDVDDTAYCRVMETD